MTMTLPSAVTELLSKLTTANYEGYVVGGCVRDFLMGREPHDYDITTNATPEQLKEVLSEYRIEDTGIKHGTVTVYLGDIGYEVTTFRTEGCYTDGRHPDSVEFVSSLEEDLARRDFTVNTIAYSPITGLVDPFGGKADLKNQIIRAVGNPVSRFTEDRLRILRAVRFASTLSRNGNQGRFTLEQDTAKAVHDMAESLSSVSKERITAELTKLLAGANVKNVMMDFPDIFTALFPELEGVVYQVQHHPWHKYNLWEHTAEVVAAIQEKSEILLWTALLHDCGKPLVVETHPKSDLSQTTYDLTSYPYSDTTRFLYHAKIGAELAEKLLKRTSISKKNQAEIVFLIQMHHSFPAEKEKSVRRWLNHYGEERCRNLMLLRDADAKGFSAFGRTQAEQDMRYLRSMVIQVKASSVPYRTEALACGGNDLLAEGIPAGPDMGKILYQLMEEVMEETVLNEKEPLVKRALAIWNEGGGHDTQASTQEA